jgi:hypothetical protein
MVHFPASILLESSAPMKPSDIGWKSLETCLCRTGITVLPYVPGSSLSAIDCISYVFCGCVAGFLNPEFVALGPSCYESYEHRLFMRVLF